MFPGLCGGGWRFHSQAQIFVPLQVAEHFLYLEKEKIQDGQCAKFSPNHNGCFPGSGMKDSKEILEFYYHFLQCNSSLSASGHKEK